MQRRRRRDRKRHQRERQAIVAFLNPTIGYIEVNGPCYRLWAPLDVPSGLEIAPSFFAEIPDLVGDGVTDDGPAIQRALNRLALREVRWPHLGEVTSVSLGSTSARFTLFTKEKGQHWCHICGDTGAVACEHWPPGLSEATDPP
jgi:hypothetical protein